MLRFDRIPDRMRQGVRRVLPLGRASVAALFLVLAGTGCGGGDGTSAPGPAATVTFSSSAFTFTASGASQVVTATIADASGKAIANAQVTWTSDNVAIAEVQGSGRTATIIAHAKGSTLIRATSGSASATISIVVLGVQAIVVSPPNATVRLGTTQNYTAQVTADAGVSQAVNWATGNVSIATVSAQGQVTPVALGTTTVQATSVADPSVSATTQITVAAAKGVVVTPSTATIGTAQTTTLTASVVLDAGQSTNVTWSSNANAIATVSQQGVVTGVALGTATITATSVADNTLKGTAIITVAPVIRSVAVTPPAPQLFINSTQQLTAVVTADAGLSQAVTWGTSNSAVATVNSAGLVTAVTLGSVTITATSAVDVTKKGTATVTVTPRPVAVSIAQRNVAISPGSTATLTAIVTADPGVSTAVTWSSSATGVASVGLNNGLVTAVTQGSTIITATSVADPTKNDTVTVNVAPRLASSWTATRLSGPMIEDIVSIFPVNSSAAWAVNDVGDVYKFDGTNWTRTAKGSDFGTVFTAVHGANASSIIAVGTGGKIVQWDGATWTAMTSGTTQDLIDVWMENATSAFAVGAGGTARKLTGSTWSVTSTGTSARLNGVWTNGSGVWFAVGNNGELLRYAANAWSRLTSSPTTEHLYDVAGISATDVYAVGAFGTVVHFDGSSWQVMGSNGITADLYALGVVQNSGAKIQVVGDGVAFQIDGALFTDLVPTFAARYTTALADLSGLMWIAGQRGLVMRNLGGSWSTLNMAPDLLDVWSTASDNSWLVGELGSVYQWNGTTWTRATVPTNVRLNSVWGLSTNLAIVGGDLGVIMRWNGTNWTIMSTPTTSDVLSVWGTSATNIYAATYAGEVLRYNGTSWSVVLTQAEPFYSVFGSGASDVYASGDLGTVKRFDGSTWTPRNVGNNALLSGVWASGQSDVYTVGVASDLGVAYRFTSAWQTMSGLSAPTLTSLWGTSAFDLYATGANGTLLRYNGSSWQPMTSGTTDLLWSVSGAPSGSGAAFAVGVNSTLVTGAGSGAITAANLFARSGSLQTASSLVSPRRLPYRPLPDGAMRRSLRDMHVTARSGAALRLESRVPPLVKFGASRTR